MDDGRILVVVATPVEMPEVVARNRWPVHVTVVGNFQVEEAFENVVADHLAALAKRTAPLTVRLGPRGQFGSDHTIPVLLAEHSSLHDLHNALGREFKKLPGFSACEPSHWENGYRPHATLGSAVRVEEGDVLVLQWLTLASLEGNRAQRTRSIKLL